MSLACSGLPVSAGAADRRLLPGEAACGVVESDRTSFEPADEGYQARVRANFAKQGAMRHIGAELARVEPGFVEIRVPHRPELTQQHGYFHAGILGTALDSAGGYAGYTLMPVGTDVLAVEYKLNLLSPADGDLLIARGRVLRAGRTLTVCELDASVETDGKLKKCAHGMQTLICVPAR